MGTFVDLAIIDYRLPVTDCGKQTSIVIYRSSDCQLWQTNSGLPITVSSVRVTQEILLEIHISLYTYLLYIYSRL
jgi:hypothetical protein